MNSSGPISLAGTTAGQSIEIENGGNGTTQISLNDAAVRSLAGVASGAITMPTDFYGKANQFNLTVSSNQTNANLRSLAVSAGWNQSSKVVATINSGVIISSNSTGTAALTINGSFPGGLTVTNNGTIVGMGGNGGAGGGNFGSPGPSSGAGGGTGLLAQTAVTFYNAGVIAGGGGGGGGGTGNNTVSGGGGGGGRSSNAANSSGGGVYGATVPGSAGGAGTYSSAGSGGGGGSRGFYCCGTYDVIYAGGGGSGGSWGASGSSGAYGTPDNYGAGGGGGGGGSATSGAGSYITWTATGTRYGAIN